MIYRLFYSFLILMLFFGCEKKNTELEGPFSVDKKKKAEPLLPDKFIEVATLYKDALDQSHRNRIVTLAEKHSRNIVYHTTNVEHMIYFAAVNGVGTNIFIVLLRKENPNLQLTKEEIDWINTRWDIESKSLLSNDFKRPQIEKIPELLDLKPTHKKINDYEYYVHFDSLEVDMSRYNLSTGYIPFYWELHRDLNKIIIPAIRFKVMQTVGMAKIDLTETVISRKGKWVNILDHPLFLWKGEIPRWAELTIKNEKYFYKSERN